MEIPDRSRFRLTLLVLLLLVLLPFAPVVIGGKCFFYTDTFNFFYPLKKTVVEILKAGEMPHWNRLSAGGKPLIGGLQSGVFYPLNFVMILMPFHRGFQVFIVIHYLLAAAWTYRLARRMDLVPAAAFLAGLTYALSGHLVSMANSMSILMVASWLPLQIHLALDFLERGRWRDAALLALATSFTFLAGAPVTFAYTAGTVVIFLVVGVVKRAWRGETWRWRGALTLAFPLVVFGISAVQFLPAQDFAGYSIRSEGVPFDDAARYSFHPLRIATFVSPFLYGNHAVDLPRAHQVAPQIIILITVYLGVIPLILAPLAFTGSRGRSIFWGCVLLLSLLVALGRHLPLYRVLYKVVPYFDQFRSPFKALVVTTFSFSILAGFGLEELFRPAAPGARGRLILITGGAWAGLLLVIVAIGFSWYGGIETDLPAAREAIEGTREAMIIPAIRGFGALAAAVALLYLAARAPSRRRLATIGILLFAAADLGLCASAATPLQDDSFYRVGPPLARSLAGRGGGMVRAYRTPPDERAGLEGLGLRGQDVFYHWRKRALAPNYGTVFGVEQFDSYDSAVLFWHSKFQNFLEGRTTLGKMTVPPEERARILGLFHVTHIISFYIFENPALQLIGDASERPLAYRNLLAFPRAYFVPRGIEVEDGNEMLATILHGKIDFTASALVTPPGRAAASVREEEMRILEANPEFREMVMQGSTGDGKPPRPIRATSWTYRPNEVEVILNAPEEGFLVLNDTYHPDWRARVGGKEVEVRRANYLVRAVPVPAGPSTVIFRFEPPSDRIGMGISLFTLILLAAIEIVSLLRRRTWKGARGGV